MSIVLASSAAALLWGWNVRAERYWTPESGLGYSLGVVGTALMLLLLLYSARKRFRFMRSLGPIRHWFGPHMLLGILGPVAIFFHSNFQLGSLNSAVAFSCMVLVAGSGLVGRFIYPKIHRGLFGSRTSLRELQADVAANRGSLGAALATSPELALELKEFESFATGARRGFASSLWHFAALPVRARRVRSRGRRSLRASAPVAEVEEAIVAVDSFLQGVQRVAGFGAYERLFSLWHAFHLPICVMLFLAAAVHVVAVHMY
jgi:hypothetical protein